MSILLLTLLDTYAATWVVDQAGGGDATTIEDGLALLEDGDTLEIRAGTYFEADLRSLATNVEIIGEGWETTTLDLSASSSYGLALQSGSYIEGLTLEGSSDEALTGDDIIVASCAILDNYEGIFTGADALAVFNSVLAQNEYAIQYEYVLEDLTLENNQFLDNSRLALGAGWHGDFDICSTYEIHHNLFVGSTFALAKGTQNTTCHSGALAILNATNNIFVGMSTSWGSGIGWTATFANNLVGTTTTENCTWTEASTTVTCTGRLVADPDFVSWTDDGDWTNDDFHYAPGSAGVDHGITGYATLATDLDGLTRPIDGDLDGSADPDAGPYEYDPATGGGWPEDTGEPDDTGDTGDTGGTSDTAETGDTGAGTDTADDPDSHDTGETGDHTGDTGPAADSDDSAADDSASDTGAAPSCAGCASGNPNGTNGSTGAFIWLAALAVFRRRDRSPGPS